MRIADLRKRLFEAYGMILNPDGFKGYKSKLEYKKSINVVNQVEFVFGILNYYPYSYEFNFCFIVWVKEIVELKKNFFAFIKEEMPVLWTTPIWEGEFISDLDDKEWKFRSGFYREIKTEEDVIQAIKLSVELLQEKAVPFINYVSVYEGFRHYYLEDLELKRRFFDMSFFVSSLLCAI